MKQILTRILLCLFLCVLFLSLIFSNFSRVNAVEDVKDVSYDVRSKMSYEESVMMQQIDYYINQQKQFSNVDGYACLNDFFDKLSYLNYSVVINSLPFPNDLMLSVYLYDNVEPLNRLDRR